MEKVSPLNNPVLYPGAKIQLPLFSWLSLPWDFKVEDKAMRASNNDTFVKAGNHLTTLLNFKIKILYLIYSQMLYTEFNNFLIPISTIMSRFYI